MKTDVQEKKSTKTLKGQLFGAISMMLVAAIALGTSTYAWFINNSTAAVDTMELAVSASQSLQIAVRQKDAATYTLYKNLLANTDITGAVVAGGGGYTEMFLAGNGTDHKLVPVSAGAAALKAGTAFFKSDNHISANSQLDSFTATTSLGEAEFKMIPLSFLASSSTSVYFGQDGLMAIDGLITALLSTKADKEEKAAEQAIFNAEAEAVKAAIRIAVVPGLASANHSGTPASTYAVEDAIIFQFDKGVPKFQGSGNNTDYRYVTDYAKKWDEPNGLYDAIKAVTANTDNKEDSAVKISAITAVESTQVQVPELATFNANKYIATVTAGANNSTTVSATEADNIPLFTLTGEVPRDVKVYIWLEGTDQDAVSAMSSYRFNINLPFAATVPTPTT